jgi:hypothetical protein
MLNVGRFSQSGAFLIERTFTPVPATFPSPRMTRISSDWGALAAGRSLPAARQKLNTYEDEDVLAIFRRMTNSLTP